MSAALDHLGPMLLRLTALLALAWAVHGLLRQRHARWRLILWRTILVCGLVLPVVEFLPRPVFTLPVPTLLANVMGLPRSVPPAIIAPLADEASPAAVRPATGTVDIAVPGRNDARQPLFAPAAPQISPTTLLVALWVAGCVVGAFRLARLQQGLSLLRLGAAPPASALQQLAGKTQDELGVRRVIALGISDAVTSPFVCGLARPTILLPRVLIESLSSAELAALLRHEIAHVGQRDLPWCIGWKWFATLVWFHPLAWKIPAAHNLACEQEADRIASDRFENRDTYAQLLAKLALRVLALPAVETQLTLNATSQVARRLEHLGQHEIGPWKSIHSLAGVALAAGLFSPVGCSLAPIRAADPQPAPASAALAANQAAERNTPTIANQTAIPVASPGPSEDRQILEALAGRLNPSGSAELRADGRTFLLVGRNRFDVGTIFTINDPKSGQDYALELVAVDRLNFTLRFRNETFTRPIKPPVASGVFAGQSRYLAETFNGPITPPPADPAAAFGSRNAAAPANPEPEITISIDVNGNYAIGGQPLTWSDLTDRIGDYAGRQNPPNIRIVADEKVPFGRVTQLMDALRRQNLNKISLTADDRLGTTPNSGANPAPKPGGATLIKDYQRSSVPGSPLFAAILKLLSGKAKFESLTVNGNGANISLSSLDSSPDPDKAIGALTQLVETMKQDETLAALGFFEIVLTEISRRAGGFQSQLVLRWPRAGLIHVPTAGGAASAADGDATKVILMLNLEAMARTYRNTASVPGQSLEPEIEARLITSDQLATNIRYFYQLEERLGFKMPELHQLYNRTQADGISSVPFSMTVKGTLSQVQQLMAALEAGPMIVRLRDYTLTTAE